LPPQPQQANPRGSCTLQCPRPSLSAVTQRQAMCLLSTAGVW
jgi:hypothetical protein